MIESETCNCDMQPYLTTGSHPTPCPIHKIQYPTLTEIDILNRLHNIDTNLNKLYNEVILKAEINMATQHPGFKAIQNKISSKQGISKERAGAILANSSRNASKKAKKANPRLKRVKGY